MSWNDAELDDELRRYEALCRTNKMQDKAVFSYWDYARRFLEWRKGLYHPRGARVTPRPTPVERVTTDGLRQQAKDYARVVEAAGRVQATIDTYYRHAMFFVRWLEGTFTPGARTRGK